MATKEERRRRGRYIKYSQHLKGEIAEFAYINGASKAAQIYTKKLNNDIAESTVRNFMKNHPISDKCWEKLQKQLGQYAHQFGIDKCLQKYNDKIKAEDILIQ